MFSLSLSQAVQQVQVVIFEFKQLTKQSACIVATAWLWFFNYQKQQKANLGYLTFPDYLQLPIIKDSQAF